LYKDGEVRHENVRAALSIPVDDNATHIALIRNGSVPGSFTVTRGVVSVAVRDVATGWRVCYTKPAEGQLTLYSPMYGFQPPADCGFYRPVPMSLSRTRSRVMHAVCAFVAHDPPAARCSCGVYALENVINGLYHLRAMTWKFAI
jgi:hypothetical protein